MNALKHGMTASLPVLPGEKAEAFQARVEGWVETLQPRNDVELFLAEMAAQNSWQLERVQRAHVARLTAGIDEATHPTASMAEKVEVAALGRRLFWDRGGPNALYPVFQSNSFATSKTSWSRLIDDPDDPARLVIRLEATLPGCEWMIERWGELRGRLAEGQSWSSTDKLKAIRLLGKQPGDAIDEADVATIFLATHAIEPLFKSPLGELECDLEAKDFKPYETKALKRAPDLGLGGEPAAARERARELLMGMVEEAISRLKAKADVHRDTVARRTEMAPALLGFDVSPEGERLRRYETTCTRLLLRTLADFNKMRRAPESVGEPMAQAGRSLQDIEITEATSTPEVVPNIIDGTGPGRGECVPANENPSPRYEAATPAGVESSPADVDDRAQRNEASSSPSRGDSELLRAAFPPGERARNFLPVTRARRRKHQERPERVGVREDVALHRDDRSRDVFQSPAL